MRANSCCFCSTRVLALLDAALVLAEFGAEGVHLAGELLAPAERVVAGLQLGLADDLLGVAPGLLDQLLAAGLGAAGGLGVERGVAFGRGRGVSSDDEVGAADAEQGGDDGKCAGEFRFHDAGHSKRRPVASIGRVDEPPPAQCECECECEERRETTPRLKIPSSLALTLALTLQRTEVRRANRYLQ